MGKDASLFGERIIPGETTLTTDVDRSPPEVANYNQELQQQYFANIKPHPKNISGEKQMDVV